MKEVKKDQINKKTILKVILIISLILIIINLPRGFGSVFFVISPIYILVCLVINVFLLVYVYESKNEKNIWWFIVTFLILMLIIPIYKELEESAVTLGFIEIHKNIFGLTLWSGY